MSKSIIIGNLFTLFAMGFNAISSTRKTPKGVLWMQNCSQVVYLISSVVLGGYSAAIQNVVSILRNLAAIRQVKSKVLEWVLVVLGVVLGIACNNRGWIGLLPVISNLQYTLAIFHFREDGEKIKLFFLISVAFFVVFNFVIYNFVGVVADTIVVITTGIALLKSYRKTSDA